MAPPARGGPPGTEPVQIGVAAPPTLSVGNGEGVKSRRSCPRRCDAGHGCCGYGRSLVVANGVCDGHELDNGLHNNILFDTTPIAYGADLSAKPA